MSENSINCWGRLLSGENEMLKQLEWGNKAIKNLWQTFMEIWATGPYPSS